MSSTELKAKNLVMPPPDSRVLTISETCATYRISKSRVFDEMNTGRLPAKRVGGRVLIGRDEADAWFAALPDRGAA